LPWHLGSLPFSGVEFVSIELIAESELEGAQVEFLPMNDGQGECAEEGKEACNHRFEQENESVLSDGP
jgi:hypothetical protein